MYSRILGRVSMIVCWFAGLLEILALVIIMFKSGGSCDHT